MALLYRPFPFHRENAFSTSGPGKTNEYLGSKLGRRDNVGTIYKVTKFGADQLRNGASTWCWNITVWWLYSPTFCLFFSFPRPAHRSQFWSDLHQSSPNLVGILIEKPSVTSKNLRNLNSRRRPPPSWISKNSCHFITYWSIIIKFK